MRLNIREVDLMNRSKEKTAMKRLFEFSGKYKALIFLSCALSIISAVAMLCPFVLIYYVIEEVIRAMPDLANVDTQLLGRLGWLAAAFAGGGMLIYFFSLLCAHIAAFYTARNMRSQALHHLAKLPMGFFTTNSSGKIRKIIDENSAATEAFIAHQIPDLIGSFITPIAMLALLVYFDWRLGLLSLISLAAGFLIQMKMIPKDTVESMKKYQDSLEDMNNGAVEYVRGIAVVKAFGQTVHSFKNFHSAIMRYKSYVTEYALSMQKPMTAFFTAINGAFFLLVPAGILLSQQTADYTSFLLSYIFYLIFTPACAVMLTKIMYTSVNKMTAEESVRRIVSLFQNKPLAYGCRPAESKDHSIEFSHVSFQYPETENEALSDISFVLPEGKVAALVGPSGSGKTTIANLIPRFWDAGSGSIFIGGTDIRNIKSDVLMHKLAFVFQDAKLFKSSVLENIRAGRPEASESEVLAAVNTAQCDDILEKLPRGLDTVIGTKGVYLSGGEQQRIALARAILKDAPIIILDEATSFADPENEHKIQLAFEKLSAGKTVLMIAHRMSTVKDADIILVVNAGRIIEKGTHDELIEKDGVYTGMWMNYRRALTWHVKGENNVS